MSGFEAASAAIGVADITIKVLNAGYTILSNVRHYGSNAPEISLKFQQLSHRYDSMQKVLFDAQKFPFLNGKRVFDVLPNHSQELVLQLLLELLRLLYAYFALKEKYNASADPVSTSPGAIHLGLTADDERIVFQGTNAGTSIQTSKRSSLASRTGWSWAFRGKREAVELNAEFGDWLKRTRAVLEDTWWPLPAFNVLSNLDTMQCDSDARTTGIAASAALRRLVIDKTKLPQDLNTFWDSVKDCKHLPSGKAVGVFEDDKVLVETLTFPFDKDGGLSDVLEERFAKIVRLLSTQSDPDFRVLPCLKYCSQISENSGQLRLLSRISKLDATPTIRTLAGLYSGIKSDQRPSLGVRFGMCHQLAESLFLLHSVDWVHRALRSDNILFIFPDDNLDKAALPHAELRICGFEASRPSADSSLGPYDNQLSRNVYRHPKRWGTPRETFTQIHDVYSLGVVLLEIGLWEGAEHMISSLKPEQRIPEQVSKLLVRHANERLGHRCGDIFADAVIKCLTLDFGRDRGCAGTASLTELERQQRVRRGLLEQVMDPLKALKAAV